MLNRLHLVLREQKWLNATDLLYQSRMMDDDECGAVDRMTGRGNRSTRRISAPVPLCSPQIPHGLIRDLTQATAVGTRRLTA
jgi:hypothetical protein